MLDFSFSFFSFYSVSCLIVLGLLVEQLTNGKSSKRRKKLESGRLFGDPLGSIDLVFLFPSFFK